MNERLNVMTASVPLVAILRGIAPDDALPVARALVRAGFGTLEVPVTSPGAFDSIERLATGLPDEVTVGGGTVLDAANVERVWEAGGRLVVAPNVCPAVIEAARARDMIVMPGFSTPTEAFLATSLGADALKLFPAEASSPRVLRALKAVLPSDVPVFPVGGIGPAVMRDWWEAGAEGFGLGGSLYRPGDSPEAVWPRGREAVSVVQTLVKERAA